MANLGHGRFSAPRFLGLESSGRLGFESLEREIETMQPDGIPELMCNPGRLDTQEVGDAELIAYHAWEGELALLKSPGTPARLEGRRVRLICDRRLLIHDGQLLVRPEVWHGR